MAFTYTTTSLYNAVKEHLIWKDLTLHPEEIPLNDSPVLVECRDFTGRVGAVIARWKGTSFVDDGRSRLTVDTPLRWAFIPQEIWLLYRRGFFDAVPKFWSSEDYHFYADRSIHGDELPSGAKCVGAYEADRPTGRFNATVFEKDGVYYTTGDVTHYRLD